MNPFSIATTALGMTAKCLTVTKELSDLTYRFKHARLTILAICSESAIINVALCNLQNLFFCSEDGSEENAYARFCSRPELAMACDTALTGCTLLYSYLNDELQDLKLAVERQGMNGLNDLHWHQKARTIWKDVTMKELQRQVHGQEMALNLLLQCFELCGNTVEIQQRLEDQNGLITQVREDIEHLRAAYPGKKSIPDSVLGDKRSVEAIFSPVGSILDDKEFDFDAEVVNTRTYRRAMRVALAYASARFVSTPRSQLSLEGRLRVELSAGESVKHVTGSTTTTMDSDLAGKVEIWSASVPGLAKSELEFEHLVNRILASQIRRFEDQRYSIGSNARLLAVHGILRLMNLRRPLKYLRKDGPSSYSPLTTAPRDAPGWLKGLPRIDTPGRVAEEGEKGAAEESSNAVEAIETPMLDENARPGRDGQAPVAMSRVTHQLITHLKQVDLSGVSQEKMHVAENTLRHPVTFGEQRRWLRVLRACQQACEVAEKRNIHCSVTMCTARVN